MRRQPPYRDTLRGFHPHSFYQINTPLRACQLAGAGFRLKTPKRHRGRFVTAFAGPVISAGLIRFNSRMLGLSHHPKVFLRLVSHGPRRVPPCWHLSVQVNQEKFIPVHCWKNRALTYSCIFHLLLASRRGWSFLPASCASFRLYARADYRITPKGVFSLSRSRCLSASALLSVAGVPSQSEKI